MKKKLLTNLHILTFNDAYDEIQNGFILIEDNLIKEIGPADCIKTSSDVDVIDCSGKVALPGLINSHTHLPMSFFKSLGHSKPEIIYSVMFPAERKLKAKDIDILTTAGAVECLRSGTTTVVEHYYFADEIAQTLKRIGLRGFIGHTTMDLMGPHLGEKEFNASQSFVEKWQSDGLITPTLAPHATDTVSQKKLLELLNIAETKNLLIHLHVAQTKREVDTIRKTYNKTPVEFLDSLGFLSPKVLAAHLIHVTDNDIAILAKKKVNYLCSVVSQLFFEKLAPIEKLWKSGVNFCIATDCVASNDTMNILNEAKMFNLALIEKTKSPLIIDARSVLAMATKNAAKALGLGDKLGTLGAGKLADILILDLNKPRTTPLHDIYNTILYAFSERDIDSVIVNGKVIIQNGKMKDICEKEISEKLIQCTKDIFNR